MKRKMTAIILTVAMVLTVLPPGAFAEEPGGEPSFEAVFSDWTGRTAIEGDTTFYIEATGTGLDGYEGVVGTYTNNNPDTGVFSPAASQSGHWMLGTDKNGKERHIYKMTMDGDGELQYQVDSTVVYYYFRLTNDNGATYFDSGKAYPELIASSPYIMIESAELPSEIAVGADLIEYSVTLGTGSPFTDEREVSVKLCSGTKETMWSPITETGTISTSTDADFINLGNGRWKIGGTFALDALTAGTELYLRISCPDANNPAYSSNSVHVLGTNSIGQFSLSGAVAGRLSFGHGEGSSYEAADDATFYLAGGIGDTVHTFTLTGTDISDTSKLSVTGGTLMPDSLVSGSMQGIYELTGGVTIPAGSTSLSFQYDGQTLHSIALDRSTLNPGSSVYATSVKKIRVASNNSVTLQLSGFNLPVSASAYTGKTEWDSKEIAFQCTSLMEENGLLTLILTPDQPISGSGALDILYNTDPLRKVTYNIGDISLDNTGYSMIFVDFGPTTAADAGSESHALLGISGEQDLTLIGKGFQNTINYIACFMEHTAAGLSAPAAQLSAKYISATQLSVSEAETKNLARGWYGVYLIADDVQISGFADAALLPKEGEEQVINPTVSINGGAESTTNSAITISMTPGSFTQVRFAESQEALSSASWQIIGLTGYTLSDGFGSKTIYFEFKDSSNALAYQTNKTILYRTSELLPAPEQCGISGVTAASDGGIKLYSGTKYTAYIYYAGDGYLGKLTVLDSEGVELEAHTLNRTATKDGNHIYSKAIVVPDAGKTLKFSLTGAYGPATLTADKAVSVLSVPAITYPNLPIIARSFGYAGDVMAYLVDIAKPVQFGFQGTPGKTATAVIKTEGAADKTINLNETTPGSGIYAGSGSIPGTASKLTGITYVLSDGGSESDSRVYTYTDHFIMPKLTFTDIDNSYNDVRLTIIGPGYYYRVQNIADSDAEFVNLSLGEYTYSLSGSSGLIKNGTKVISSGNNTVSLSDLPKLSSLSFDAAGTVPANTQVKCSFILNGKDVIKLIQFDNELKQIPAGTEVAYELVLPYDAVKTIQPAAGTVTLSEVANSATVGFVPYEMVSVSGKVTNEVSGKPLAGAMISALQKIGQGLNEFYASSNDTADAEGNYSLSIYKDEDAAIRYQSGGYREVVVTDDYSVNTVINKAMQYDTLNKVSVDFMTYPLAENGEQFESPKRTDNGYITLKNAVVDNVSLNTAYYAWEYTGSGYTRHVKLSSDTISKYPGKNVLLSFQATKEYVLDNDSVNVSLNADSNGHAVIKAYQKGIISADVDGISPSYLLVFDGNGKLQGEPVKGSLRLTSETLYLDEGSYTVMVLRGDNLTRLNGLRSLTAIQTLIDAGLLDSECYSMRSGVSVTTGRITNLGNLSPSENVTNEMLGAVDVRINTESTEELNGEIYANITIEKAAPEGSAMNFEGISFWRANDPVNATNKYYINGKERSSINLLWGSEKTAEKLRAAYALGPDDNTLISGGKVQVSYKLNGTPFTENYDISEAVQKVTLTAPSSMLSGEPAKNVEVGGIAKSGEKVEIYDDKTKIAEVTAGTGNRWQASVSLLNPERSGYHSLWAKSGTAVSPEVICKIFRQGSMSYISNFKWVHHNTSVQRDITVELTDLSKINSAALQSLSYYPAAPSTISFKINGLKKDKLNHVWLINTVNGSEKSFSAACIEDGADSSVWSTGKVYLGQTGKLAVRYDLASSDTDDIYMLTGDEKPSVSILLNAANPADLMDPAKVPAAIRDNADQADFTIDETAGDGSGLAMTHDAGGLTVENEFEFIPEDEKLTEAQLEEEGYLKVVTKEGTLWVKQEVTETEINGIVTIEMNRKVFMDDDLASQLEGRRRFGSMLFTSGDPGSSPLIGSLSLFAAGGAGDAALTGIEWSGNITGGLELVGDLKGVAYVSEKFVKGVSILGAVGTVAKIAGGPSTKDANILIQALKNIENADTRRALAREIADYSALANDIYASECFSSSAMTGIGFAANTPLTKGATLIGGLANGAIGSMTVSEMDAMWNSIAISIQMELKGEMLQREKEWREKERQKELEKEKEMLRLEAFLNSCYNLGHTWIDPAGYVTLEPTETTQGVLSFDCSRCKKTYGISIPATGKQEDKDSLGTEEEIPEINVIIDPSGYVFEGLESNRAASISAIVYKGSSLGDTFSAWNDTITAQSNPQTTGLDGRYGWDVPAGTWKVGFSGTGYLPAESKVMTVPPAHTEVNIGMLSTTPPTVAAAAIGSNQLDIQFSNFMRKESIYDAGSATSNILVYDSSNSIVPGTITFPVTAANTGYVDGDYQQDLISSAEFVKCAAFTPSASYAGGFRQYQDDGTTTETYKVVVSQNVQSYSGVRMRDDYENALLTYAERSQLTTPTANKESGAYSDNLSITLTSAEGAGIYYTLDGSVPNELSTVYTGPIAITEDTELRFVAAKAGFDPSQAGVREYFIDTTKAAAPTASVNSGTYAAAQTVSLTTNTAGADIYYTVDSSAPSASSQRYSTPVTVSESTVIKALAVKSGLNDSSVTVRTYTIGTSEEPSNTNPRSNRPKTVAEPIIVQPPTAPWQNPFTDVPGNSWYYDAIQYVHSKGLFTGMGQDTFSPNFTMTRAMLVTVLHRLAGTPNANGDMFDDVMAGQWYSDSVTWAAESGIVSGYSSGLFGSNDPITREQMVTILYRYAKEMGYNITASADLAGFTDAGQTSSWSQDAVRWAVAAGLISGKGNGILDPKGKATRAEVALIFMRFNNNITQ
ncbi:MAG: S-layer homology domain-containing protein [Eubacteriales bacterium]|nr:S-layer homology domain-containing protein [Eubacteriales bacterium]MDD4629265.1 S-layer homology domain-containing protein [Eubacteriales bacterium]